MGDRENRYNHHHNHRPRSGQNRLYNSLGVKDLRELLDKKRSERGDTNEGTAPPPPDPSFNYLKDPLRENQDDTRKDAKKQYDKNQRSTNSGKFTKNYNKGPKNQDIENPCNIKIEFSTSTGEHTYKLDETNTLPTIKHVPDVRQPFHQKPRRGFGGRGRGRSPRQYQTRTIKNKNNQSSNQTENENAEKVEDVEENWSENETTAGENSNLTNQDENISQDDPENLAEDLEKVDLNDSGYTAETNESRNNQEETKEKAKNEAKENSDNKKDSTE